MNAEEKYKTLIQILKDADNDGLFDRKTSELALVPSIHRQKIREAIREHDSNPLVKQ